MEFLKEIFEENRDEIKSWAGIAITILCLGGFFWLLNNVL